MVTAESPFGQALGFCCLLVGLHGPATGRHLGNRALASKEWREVGADQRNEVPLSKIKLLSSKGCTLLVAPRNETPRPLGQNVYTNVHEHTHLCTHALLLQGGGFPWLAHGEAVSGPCRRFSAKATHSTSNTTCVCPAVFLGTLLLGILQVISECRVELPQIHT